MQAAREQLPQAQTLEMDMVEVREMTYTHVCS
jgi:hypothetical protein